MAFGDKGDFAPEGPSIHFIQFSITNIIYIKKSTRHLSVKSL